ncbi:MAG: hypothetical protein H6573_03115 [Lewinellaceae bacterium]|nr:hypothetical protein [Phaeodactylibacter sp.]MCB9346484.1 hypothetical protein [Lewinellaceae bacterium]
MRNFILRSLTLTVLLLFVSFVTYGQQVEKTLVKSFNIQGSQIVALQMSGPIEVRTWSNNFLRVQMQVSLKEGSEALLKSLVQAGRYNLRSEIGNDAYNVLAPQLGLEVKVGGKQLQDEVSYIVFAPENVTVKLPETKSASEAGASSSL